MRKRNLHNGGNQIFFGGSNHSNQSTKVRYQTQQSTMEGGRKNPWGVCSTAANQKGRRESDIAPLRCSLEGYAEHLFPNGTGCIRCTFSKLVPVRWTFCRVRTSEACDMSCLDSVIWIFLSSAISMFPGLTFGIHSNDIPQAFFGLPLFSWCSVEFACGGLLLPFLPLLSVSSIYYRTRSSSWR